jgi:hypothetical protein
MRKVTAPLQVCANCSKCTDVFRVDPEFHRRTRRMVRTSMREHGGNFALDFGHRRLISGQKAVGKYDQLQLMERGVVDWHLHPGKCQKKTCALGLPSPDDLVNIAIGVQYGTVGHLLYSAEGTYRIQLVAQLQRIVQRSPDAMRRFVGKIQTEFNQLDDQFQESAAQNYKKYMRDWMKLAKRTGFTVRLFRKDALPSIRIPYDCHFAALGRVLPTVDVPQELESYFLGAAPGAAY